MSRSSAILRFFKIACKVQEMRRGIRRSTTWTCSRAICIIAAALMAMPISASVLCISPDGHVAIENLNAACCASPGITSHGEPLPVEAIRAHDECFNCTDLPFLSNAAGTLQRGYSFSASGSFAEESSRNLGGAFAASWSLSQKEHLRFFISPPVSSAVPLRC